MNFAMKLHYQLLAAQAENADTLPILLIHGLFGNLDNLGVLARDLNQRHSVIKVDLRNHGLSPRSDEMSYAAMAQDLLTLLDDLQIARAIVIGHSMGGKAAMALYIYRPTYKRNSARRHRRSQSWRRPPHRDRCPVKSSSAAPAAFARWAEYSRRAPRPGHI